MYTESSGVLDAAFTSRWFVRTSLRFMLRFHADSISYMTHCQSTAVGEGQFGCFVSASKSGRLQRSHLPPSLWRQPRNLKATRLFFFFHPEPFGYKAHVAFSRQRRATNMDKHDFILVFLVFKHLVSAQTWTGLDDVSPRSRR